MNDSSGNINTKIDFSSNSFKKYFANTSWLFFERILRIVITFIVSVFVVRYLGLKDRKCPAGVCTALITFSVNAETCKACGICKRVCPTKAIAGEPKKVHVIDPDRCIKCGACFRACKFKAIRKQ